MVHQRRWCVGSAQPSELAEILGHSWTLCTGLECPPGARVFWLNDSFTEDSIQEYAVVRECANGQWEQIESITVSWCDRDRLTKYAEQFGQPSAIAEMGRIDPPRLESPGEHRGCGCCR